MVNAVNTNPIQHRSSKTVEGDSIPAQSRHSPPVQNRKSQLSNMGESALPGLKAKSQEGAARLKAGTGELSKLLGQKIKEKVSEQLTPEKLASAAMTVGKIVVKSAPALAAGPAGLAAFGAAVMANGGAELAKDIVEKSNKKIADPEVQKRVLTEGMGMVTQAFSSHPSVAKSD
jgi:hypothetical protein